MIKIPILDVLVMLSGECAFIGIELIHELFLQLKENVLIFVQQFKQLTGPFYLLLRLLSVADFFLLLHKINGFNSVILKVKVDSCHYQWAKFKNLTFKHFISDKYKIKQIELDLNWASQKLSQILNWHYVWYNNFSLFKFRNMWIFNWFKSTLESLGLMNKNAKIVFLGLDDAGKTTLLLRLKQDVMKQMDPTQQPYSEQLVMGKIRFKAWDLGGHQAARKTWRNYVSDVDGIIYLVDSSNHKRFQQSKIQLQGVLQMPQLQKVPIVILGNKIDKAGAVPQNQLRQALGVDSKETWSQNNIRPMEVFMCSVAKKSGYTEAFKWLSNYLK